MVLMTPSTAATIPRAGKRIGHVLQRMRAVQFLMERLLELPRHHVLDLVRIVGVHPHHPQVIADHVGGVVVGQDLGEFLERRTFGRLSRYAISSAIGPLLLASRVKKNSRLSSST